VIAADDARHAGDIAQHKPVTAMGAGIVEGLDRAVLLPDHDDRFPAEVVAHDVARLLEFGQHAAEMPDLRPQVAVLAIHPLLRDVAVCGDGVAAHRRIEFLRVAGDLGLEIHDGASF